MRNFMALPWLNSLFHRASVIVPANTSTRDLLIEQGLKPKPVMLDTGSPVHDETIDLSRPTKISEDGCRFVYAGRLEARKGLPLSIRAFGLACQNREFCGRFAIIGDGPQKKYLFDLVQSLGLRERVSFLGQRSLAEVYFELRASDVFLFSSVRDTSGGVNLEAMSLGLPVICINHQGVEDITTDRCALRVNPDTIQSTIENLAEMIVKMANDPELRNRLSIEAIRRAKEDFRWEDKFVKMVSYYQESLSGRPLKES
jgi:glycosyltransferase involved in cell wall biosynthesis